VSDKSIVPPRAHDKEYPRTLEAAVMKALDRKRDARFQSCAEFEAALDEVFAKEVSRARTEDIGKFMRKMFGARGDERRAALAEAVRVADERAAGRVSLTELPSSQRLPQIAGITPPSGTTASVDRMTLDVVPGTDPHARPVTPYGATIPASAKSKSRRGAMILGTLAIGAAVAFFASRRPVDQKAAFASQPQDPVATQPSAMAPPPLPIAHAAEPDAGGLVFEPVKDTTPAKGPAARPGHRPAWRPPVTAVAKPAPSAKPPVATAAAPPQKSGFIPPPVTNPGF